jgi:uncharacterized protein (TIGR03083 family)
VFLACSAASLELLDEPAVALRWREPSVLDGFGVGDLAAHLARSTHHVEMFLDADEPSDEPITAVDYYARLVGVRDPESELNVGVRARSAESSALGAEGVATAVRAALERLERRLPREPDTRQLSAMGRTLLLDEYLRTRMIEMAVHTDDLALSVGIEPPQLPRLAYTSAITTLVDVARMRSGDVEVLHALTRRERDVDDALRVL